MKWDAKQFDIKKQKFHKTFLCSQKHFISSFENFYSFKIPKDNEPNGEFERLAKHMNMIIQCLKCYF